MAVPPSNNVQHHQHMLQVAVQAVQWTYSIFWQFCPRQGILVWTDGYYNGAIKTRKTVQPSMDVSAEETCLQRSLQLRELYDSLSAGDTTQAGRRPCAALSPEDLTETEWFYLMCVSFSFPPGVGLPGKAYANGQHVWLAGANEVDSKVFSRAILAKSAHVQTVVCIPIMEGVVELGFTERVEEDPCFIQQVKSVFINHYPHQGHSTSPSLPPKPALSEHSTSNPNPSPSGRSHFNSPLASTNKYASPNPPPLTIGRANDEDDDEEEDDEDEDDEDEAQTNLGLAESSNPGLAQPSELMQLEMPEDIRLGSPEDASNNLGSDFPLTTASSMTQLGDPPSHELHRVDSFRLAESTRRWPVMQPQQQQQPLPALVSNDLHQPPLGDPPLDELSQEDRHYSQTVSLVLQYQTSLASSYLSYSPNSAFSRWNAQTNNLELHLPVEGTSQWLLKYILFTVPFLHTKNNCEDNNVNCPKSSIRGPSYTALARFRPGKGSGTPQDELSANHVLAERRRREKLNERFIILRSLVPFVTKMDKASILGDTIEYVKQLCKKIQDLEAHARQMELERVRSVEPARSGERDQRSGSTELTSERGIEKRKVRVVEGTSGSRILKPVEIGDMLQVSIIESDALVELQCPYKEGLLLDVMLKLRELRLEVIAVQSSLNNGFIVAELRAKVKENANGKKASIVEVKRAVYQLVPHTDS